MTRSSYVEGDGRPAVDLFELLESGDPPAFATDHRHRIVFWNRGAERTLGMNASLALGRHCYELMSGRDAYGNRFCYENCPITATVRRGEAAGGCEVTLHPPGSEPRNVALTILNVPGLRPGMFTLVHLLRPVEAGSQFAWALKRLAESSPGNGHADPPPEALPTAPPPLTAREKEILGLVAAGLQNKEVAQRLGISLATVRNHIHNILEKLDVHSKLEAVSLAFRSGWVTKGVEQRA